MRVRFKKFINPDVIPRQGIDIFLRQPMGKIDIEGYIARFIRVVNRQKNVVTDLISLNKSMFFANRRVLEIREVIGRIFPDPIVTNVWYDLRIVAQGNDISFSVNEDVKIFFTDKDNPFTHGKLQFEVYNAHN